MTPSAPVSFRHPVFGGEEVARGEDRNAEPALGFGYGLPVRLSTKALLGRARMERHEACAGVLEAQGKVEIKGTKKVDED